MTTCYYLSPTRQATASDMSTHPELISKGYSLVSFFRWLIWSLVHRGGDIDDTQKKTKVWQEEVIIDAATT